ncbi:MAG: ABC transporter permease [Ignavibacteriales bacterium]|nr:MAG: ABC transporter permease [Ignavibacteriales bacterium]
MITLIRIELFKIFKKWRTYIGFIAIGLLVGVIQLAMALEGSNSLKFMTRNIQQSFLFVGNLLNGYFVSYLILGALAVHIPFLITLVAGDLLAGEATAGTYRLLITRPVSRFRIVASKFIAGMIYTAMLILFLAVMSLGLGTLIFGTGELLVLSNNTIIIFATDDIIWRFLFGYAFATLSMTVVTALAFLFSSLVENAIGPIVTTMAIIIVFLIISAIQIDIFQTIQPYLFTTYMSSWRSFFDDPVDYNDILQSVLVLVGHIVGLFSLTVYLFRKKDILT